MPAGPESITTPNEAADYLYGLPADEFVSSRNELAKTAKGRGDRDLANEITSMRKPNVLAAELNRLLRSKGSELEQLLEAANALADAHRSVLSGESVDLAELRQLHRRSATELAQAADRNRDEIGGLLEAASLDTACHDGLRLARYVTEPAPEVGFDLFGDAASVAPLASVTSIAEARARKRPTAQPEARSKATFKPENAAESNPEPVEAAEPDRELRAAQTRIEAKARNHEQAEKALALVYRRVEASVAKNAKASERVVVLGQRLAAAEANLTATGADLGAARQAAENAEAALSSSADALREARAALPAHSDDHDG